MSSTLARIDDEFLAYIKSLSDQLSEALGKDVSIAETTLIVKMCMKSRGPITIYIDGKRSKRRASIQDIDVQGVLSLKD